MEWIDASKQLPPDNKKCGGEIYIVTVVCYTWEKPQTMIMNWECAIVRNKEVKRWKWLNSLKSENWIVTHWAELPPPAIN